MKNKTFVKLKGDGITGHKSNSIHETDIKHSFFYQSFLTVAFETKM